MSAKLGYHVTTPKKLARYEASGRILAPVRFWGTVEAAQHWAKKVQRPLILVVERPAPSYPLPIKGPAWWTPQDVVGWEVL